MLKYWWAAAAAGLAACASASLAQYLLVPEVNNHRVMLCSDFDASVVDPDFLRHGAGGNDLLQWPRAAAAAGPEFWVTDIRGGAVHRFSAAAPHAYLGPLQGPFSRPSGICVRGDRVYISDVGAGTNGEILNYTTAGVRVGQFAAPNPVDVACLDQDLLISDYDGNAVRRYSASGGLLGIFASVHSPTQIHVAASGIAGAEEVWVASYSGPAGVYRLSAAGELVSFRAVGGNNLGVHTLGNGRVAFGGGLGFETFDPDSPGPSVLVEDFEVQFIQAFGACASRCAADYDASGGVDGSDVQAFFTDWSDGLPCTDVNRNGGVDGADVADFFAAWEAAEC